MNITYTVRFRGVPEKYASALETMIQDDIGTYTARMSMESATVNILTETVVKPEKVEANAKSRQRKS